jgi:hypothetical protein
MIWRQKAEGLVKEKVRPTATPPSLNNGTQPNNRNNRNNRNNHNNHNNHNNRNTATTKP